MILRSAATRLAQILQVFLNLRGVASDYIENSLVMRLTESNSAHVEKDCRDRLGKSAPQVSNLKHSTHSFKQRFSKHYNS